MTMTDLMVDIETMGTGHNAPILSIGAVEFNPHTEEMGAEFYVRATLASQRERPIDADTLEWWLKQGEAARGALFEGQRLTLQNALREFKAFAHESTASQLWSNGPTFDEDILRHAFLGACLDFPFKYRDSRCCRTAKHFGAVARAHQGNKPAVKHDALEDAKAQALNVIAVFQAVRAKRG